MAIKLSDVLCKNLEGATRKKSTLRIARSNPTEGDVVMKLERIRGKDGHVMRPPIANQLAKRYTAGTATNMNYYVCRKYFPKMERFYTGKHVGVVLYERC